MFIRRSLLLVCLTLAPSFSWPAAAADLVAPTANAPRYQLSNLRTENDRFGGQVIAFDYRRTRAGAGSVQIKGKTTRGDLSISAFVPSDDSGTIRLSSLFGRGAIENDIELYLVQSHRIGTTTLFALVSNSVRRGNPGPAAQSRPWTAAEQAAAAEFERIMNDDSAHKPIKEYKVTVAAPTGSDFLANTVKVTKGTKLQACFQDSWHPLTVISENDDGTVNVRWDKYGKSFDCSMQRGELVIENAVAAKLGKHPDSLYAKTVPNWASPSAKDTKPPAADAKRRKSYPVSIPVPSDSQFVPADLQIKAGTPVQACYAAKWNPLTVISENDDGTLNVHWNEWGSASDCSMVRSELIIKKKALDPTHVEEVTIAPIEPPKRRKKYAVTIPVPRDSEFVPKDAKLAVGTKLQACWAGKWNPITMLSHANDGTLNVHWDDFGSTYDCSMLREELIIKKATLRELTSAASGTDTPVVRTWTDATGQFKVKAKLIKQSSTQVTLLTEAGKEVTLPLSKLSEADQEFLQSSTKAANPFE